MEKEVYLLER